MKKQTTVWAVLAALLIIVSACSKENISDATVENHETQADESPVNLDCWEKPEIMIVRACTDDIAPVCACKVISFNHRCEAEALGFKNFEPGLCPKNRCQIEAVGDIFDNVLCPSVIQPVCGCNGITYRNNCEALRNGVVAWTPGTCDGNPYAPIGDGKVDKPGISIDDLP